MTRPKNINFSIRKLEAIELSPAIVYRSITLKLFTIMTKPSPRISKNLKDQQAELRAEYDANYERMKEYSKDPDSKEYLECVLKERKLNREGEKLNKKIRRSLFFGIKKT